MSKTPIIVDVHNDCFAGGAMKRVDMKRPAGRRLELANTFCAGQLALLQQHSPTRPGAGGTP